LSTSGLDRPAVALDAGAASMTRDAVTRHLPPQLVRPACHLGAAAM